ncbi:MAG: exodeoxyribonuclease VII small subunit [Burkholderiaceae bacterium]
MATKPRPKPQTPTDVDPDLAQLSFEQAVEELERIVASMEAGELPLQQALSSYQRGAALVGRCRGALEDARLQVKVLEGDLLKPFVADTDGEDA